MRGQDAEEPSRDVKMQNILLTAKGVLKLGMKNTTFCMQTLELIYCSGLRYGA